MKFTYTLINFAFEDFSPPSISPPQGGKFGSPFHWEGVRGTGETLYSIRYSCGTQTLMPDVAALQATLSLQV